MQQPRFRPPRAQQGSVLVQFAFVALVLLAMLGTVQVGSMYSAKRDLQRIADIAALESSNAIQLATSCSEATAAARTSIDAQWPLGVNRGSDSGMRIECGHWTRMNGFAATSPFNATRVTLAGDSLQLLPFSGSRTIMATSTAAIAGNPIGAFTAGSGVARLNDGALNSLLGMLLGTTLNLSLADYEGLASTNVNLLGIMDALQIDAGNYSELLDTEISLRELINASIQVAQNLPDQATANIAIAALRKLLALPARVDLANTFIHLLQGANGNGLLDVGIYQDNPATALNADASVLSLVKTALQVANADSAAALQTSLDLGLLAKATVAAKVIEPPVIAVGPAGTDGAGRYMTTAHTGQVRLNLNLQVVNSLSATGNLLDINLLLLRLRVSLPTNRSAINLPVYLEVASGDARLKEIACHQYGSNVHKASIDAKPGIASLLLGQAPDAMTNTSAPWTSLSKDFFHLLDLNVKATLLGDLITVVEAPVKLMAKLDLDTTNSQSAAAYQQLDFRYSTETARSAQDLVQTAGTRNQLGSYLGNAFNQNLLQFRLDTSGLTLLGLRLDYLSSIVDGLVNSLSAIVSALTPLLSALLTPVFSLLDSLLGPLLGALGLQVGYADVELLWADCNPAQLVN